MEAPVTTSRHGDKRVPNGAGECTSTTPPHRQASVNKATIFPLTATSLDDAASASSSNEVRRGSSGDRPPRLAQIKRGLSTSSTSRGASPPPAGIKRSSLSSSSAASAASRKRQQPMKERPPFDLYKQPDGSAIMETFPKQTAVASVPRYRRLPRQPLAADSNGSNTSGASLPPVDLIEASLSTSLDGLDDIGSEDNVTDTTATNTFSHHDACKCKSGVES